MLVTTTIFAGSFLTGCSKTETGDVEVGQENSDTQPMPEAAKSPDEMTMLELKEQREAQLQERITKATASISDPTIKENVAAGIEMGVLSEASCVDEGSDEKTFASYDFSMPIPTLYKKAYTYGLCSTLDSAEEDNYRYIGIQRRARYEAGERELDNVPNGWTIEDMSKRYLADEAETQRRAEDTNPIKQEDAVLVNEPNKYIIRQRTINTEENNKVMSVDYYILNPEKNRCFYTISCSPNTNDEIANVEECVKSCTIQ